MMAREGRGFRVAVQAIMFAMATIMGAPLVVALVVSLRGDGLGNYLAVVGQPLLPRFFLNSAVISAATIAIVYVCAGCAAFALAKLRLRGREAFFLLLIAGLMIPPVAMIVPVYLAVRTLGLFGSPLAVIVPEAAILTPLGIVLIRGFLAELPNEIIEAARIDGCTSAGVLWRIVRPLASQITTVVIIYTFLASWNEFFLPLAFLQQEADQTVTQAPQFFMGQFGQDTGKVFASLVLISIPVVAAYLSARNAFQDGISAGAVK